MSLYRPRIAVFAVLVCACHAAPTPSPSASTPLAQTPLAPATGGASESSASSGTCPDDANDKERQFCAAAARAMHAVDEDDSDDAAPLLALLNVLETDADLSRLGGLFEGPLGHALARAQLLAHLGKALRQLRRAVQDVYLDPRTGLYRGVDNEACRASMKAFESADCDWRDLKVTIEPLGTYRLATLRRFCLESRTLPREGL